MKKAQLPLLLVLVSLLNVYSTNAQNLSSQVKNNFPKGIIIQVFDIAAKANLLEDKQISIANILLQKENALHQLILSSATIEQILASKAEFDAQINAILNVEQKFEKQVKTTKEERGNKYSYSQFSIAIQHKDELGLNASQVSSLYSSVETLKQLKNTHFASAQKPLDTRAYESANISQILTSSQYDQLLAIKNQRKAEDFANNDWIEIKERGLDNLGSKEAAIKMLTEYYLMRESIYNKYQHDPILQKSEAKAWHAQRPVPLKALEKARRSPENTTLGEGFTW